MENDLDKLKSKLKEVRQEHVLTFWNELELEEKEILKKQIESIDFVQIEKRYENSKKDEPFDINSISPIPYVNSLKMSQEEKKKYIEIGEEVIKKEELAVVSMAGGQRYKAWISWTKSYF